MRVLPLPITLFVLLVYLASTGSSEYSCTIARTNTNELQLDLHFPDIKTFEDQQAKFQEVELALQLGVPETTWQSIRSNAEKRQNAGGGLTIDVLYKSDTKVKDLQDALSPIVESSCSLPVLKDWVKSRDGTDEVDTCAFCKNPASENGYVDGGTENEYYLGPWVMIGCEGQHKFHLGCLSVYTKDHQGTTCPMCRQTYVM